VIFVRRRLSGTPVFFDRDKLLNSFDTDKTMSYSDEHYGTSKISYDGELINLQDASYRLKRDRARQHNYARAEELVDEEQLTWDEVNKRVEDEDSLLSKLI